MKRRALSLLLLPLLLSACDSAKSNTRDPLTGLTTDSVKMEFKDTTTLILWGVPYSRFSLELRVHTGADNQKTTDAVATCNHIVDGPLSITIDRQDHTWPGTLESEKTERYLISPDDLRALAYAKSAIVRVYHGTDRHEDADIGPDRLRQIRKLYEKNFPATPPAQ